MSPTQRTIRALKEQGRLCGIVERFISNSQLGHGIRSDLFGIFDVVALCPGRGIIGVQSCGSDFSGHYRKITEEKAENAMEWLKSGGVIEIYGWRKIKLKRGGKAERWAPRVQEITLKDFEKEPSIICPKCGMESYNPNDIKNQYCGNCHQFHEHFKWENETA